MTPTLLPPMPEWSPRGHVRGMGREGRTSSVKAFLLCVRAPPLLPQRPGRALVAGGGCLPASPRPLGIGRVRKRPPFKRSEGGLHAAKAVPGDFDGTLAVMDGFHRLRGLLDVAEGDKRRGPMFLCQGVPDVTLVSDIERKQGGQHHLKTTERHTKAPPIKPAA